jgi:hypothetical protein
MITDIEYDIANDRIYINSFGNVSLNYVYIN